MKASMLPLLMIVLAGFVQPAGVAKVRLDKEFVLKTGQKAVVQGERLTIRFSSVSEDSRCPQGVACIWHGNAGIVIEVVRKNAKGAQAVLNTDLSPREFGYKGYKIKLLRLDPYPKAPDPIHPQDYEATLVVTKE